MTDDATAGATDDAAAPDAAPDAAATDEAKPLRPVHHLGAGLVGLACAVAGGGGAVAYAGQHWWVFDLASHFRAQYAIVLAIGLAVMALQRRRWPSLVVGALMLLNLAPMLPYLVPSWSAGQTDELRVATINVYTGNQRHDAVIAWILQEKPDVIGLQEIDATWLAALTEGLGAEYPYHRAHPRGDNFGLAVFSRYPITHDELIEFDGVSVPTMLVEVDALVGGLSVIVAHPTPPSLSAGSHVRRDHALAAIGDRAATIDGAVILLGDLNTSQWSWVFRDLCRRSGLRDAGRQHGINPTWHPGLPPFFTPLDHILASPSLAVESYRAGPNLGSDHRPVIATFGRH